jgi:hypothetical protein
VQLLHAVHQLLASAVAAGSLSGTLGSASCRSSTVTRPWIN